MFPLATQCTPNNGPNDPQEKKWNKVARNRWKSMFRSRVKEDDLLLHLLFDLFHEPPETYFWATLGLLYFFWNFLSCGSHGPSQLQITSQEPHFRSGKFTPQTEIITKLIPKTLFYSGGRWCLGEGRLGVAGQVWEFRLLPSFPSFPRENRSSRNVWESGWKSQTSSSRHPRPSDLCNWNEIFQENNSQTIFPCNSLSHKRTRVM